MNDTIRPDEVISPEDGTAVQLRDLAKDVVLFLPNLIKLIGRLTKDPRVPRRSKVILGGLLLYIISPIDLVPDAIPVVGVMDELLLSAYALNHLISRAGPEVVLEHWDGPQDLLELVQTVLDTAGSLVPAPLQRWIDRLNG